MDLIKTSCTLKSSLLLLVMSISIISFNSCKDDDEPNQGNNELVGEWYFYDDYYDEIDFEDYFTFRSNGTGYYNYDNDPENSDSFTYTYDSDTKILTLNYKNWDKERIRLTWMGKDKVDFDDYGIYIRK